MTMTASMGEIIYALGVGFGVGVLCGMLLARWILEKREEADDEA
jgi:glycine/D-amino acid oxidase-like deaminating enzyme